MFRFEKCPAQCVKGKKMRKWTAVLILFLIPSLCFAGSATERLQKAFNIQITGALDERTLREAIIKAIPPGSSSGIVLKRLDERGLDFRGTCFPGDTSPITCTILSSKNSGPSFSFEFVFDKHHNVSDVKVTRW